MIIAAVLAALVLPGIARAHGGGSYTAPSGAAPTIDGE
jgi:hypothetical protein